jgi:isopentenyl diphosphate isomerase/L-lactate dehydrogenase-like FMN-dependent dehydrogenase
LSDLTRTALNIEDLRQLSRRRLTKALFEFCDRGSEDEVLMRDNRAALDAIKLLPRVLHDVSDRDPAVTLFGKRHDLPIVISPTGAAGWVWYRGETAMARAAAAAGIPFTLASNSNTPMEQVLARGGGTQWFQLYVWRDIEAALATVERAREAGYAGLVLTVDSTTYNNREWDIRNGAVFPPKVTGRTIVDSLRHPRWTLGTLGRYLAADRGMPAFPNVNVPAGYDKVYVSGRSQGFFRRNDTLTWDFVRRVRDLWPGTLIVKGILHPADAVTAADCGADGIFVSNHAGNVLDAGVPAITMLPHIVAAAGGRLTIIVDSGFRRGSDVLKAMALGADAVGIGRASLYGAAAAGEAGVRRAIAIFEAEIRRTMGNVGVRDLASLTRDHVMLPGDIRPFEGDVDPAAAACDRLN